MSYLPPGALWVESICPAGEDVVLMQQQYTHVVVTVLLQTQTHARVNARVCCGTSMSISIFNMVYQRHTIRPQYNYYNKHSVSDCLF